MRVFCHAAYPVLALVQLHFGAPAIAQSPLPYSYGFTAIRVCSAYPCEDTTIQQSASADYNYNVDLTVDVVGKGRARASAAPGDATTFELPVIRAESTVTGAATSTAFVQAFQGYRNVSDQTLELAFAGYIDFTAIGPGYGFVLPSMAILSSAVVDPAVGALWLDARNDGAFIADCQTPAAISVVNGPKNTDLGNNSIMIDSSTGNCGGNGLFSVAPGDSFYVLSRLLTFQATPGVRDAFNTFRVGLSPLVSESTRALLPSALRPISLTAVPEPMSWTTMIVGWLAIGIASRSRRRRSRRCMARH